LLTWLGLAGAPPLLLKRNNSSRSPIVVYASGMIVIGILMTFLNCFFAQIQPRFALPMMELVLLPFIIVLGLLLTESAQSFRRNVR
jgi:predicted tellurium resistance membrane protein TerC